MNEETSFPTTPISPPEGGDAQAEAPAPKGPTFAELGLHPDVLREDRKSVV